MFLAKVLSFLAKVLAFLAFLGVIFGMKVQKWGIQKIWVGNVGIRELIVKSKK